MKTMSIFGCLVSLVVYNVLSADSVPVDSGGAQAVTEDNTAEEATPYGTGASKEHLTAIIERRRVLEAIRLSEVVVLKSLEDTKLRSEELTRIMDNRIYYVSNLYRRLPTIVAHLLSLNPQDTLEMPLVSSTFLTTTVGLYQEPVEDLDVFFSEYFQNNKHSTAMKNAGSGTSKIEVKELVAKAKTEIKRLGIAIGINYLGSSMSRVTETVQFIDMGLKQSEDILARMTELVTKVMIGPYDTISNDRLFEGYELLKRQS